MIREWNTSARKEMFKKCYMYMDKNQNITEKLQLHKLNMHQRTH
jgi:hypothetical protein